MTNSCWFLLLFIAAPPAAGKPPGRIEIPSMVIKLVEQVDVPAREAGVLAEVRVREGQLVREGDLLAQIDDTEAQLAEQRAKIDVDIARANVENDVNLRFAKKTVEVAEAELQRSVKSNEKYPQTVSASELDRLRLLVEKSKLEVEQAEHQHAVALFTQATKENEHRTAQAKVQRHQLSAPLSGIAVQVNRRRGEWVKPGEPVVHILRMDRLRAEGFIPAQHASQDLQGQAVRLTVDLPDASGTLFPAKIVFLDPEIDPVNAQVRIWAEIENQGLRLRPGMRATMTITPEPRKQ